jgi:hypothetical protein
VQGARGQACITASCGNTSLHNVTLQHPLALRRDAFTLTVVYLAMSQMPHYKSLNRIYKAQLETM